MKLHSVHQRSVEGPANLGLEPTAKDAPRLNPIVMPTQRN